MGNSSGSGSGSGQWRIGSSGVVTVLQCVERGNRRAKRCDCVTMAFRMLVHAIPSAKVVCTTVAHMQCPPPPPLWRASCDSHTFNLEMPSLTCFTLLYHKLPQPSLSVKLVSITSSWPVYHPSPAHSQLVFPRYSRPVSCACSCARSFSSFANPLPASAPSRSATAVLERRPVFQASNPVVLLEMVP